MPGYFLMTPEVAEKFFDRCLMKEAVTDKERLEVLKGLEAEGQILARGSTPDTQEEFARKLAQHANVLIVKKEKNPRD